MKPMAVLGLLILLFPHALQAEVYEACYGRGTILSARERFSPTTSPQAWFEANVRFSSIGCDRGSAANRVLKVLIPIYSFDRTNRLENIVREHCIERIATSVGKEIRLGSGRVVIGALSGSQILEGNISFYNFQLPNGCQLY